MDNPPGSDEFEKLKKALNWSANDPPNVTKVARAKPWEIGAREIISRNLSGITMRAIDWLWVGWIPKGYITIWAGESGAGKSTVLTDVAARISTGAPWPGESPDHGRNPGYVLWLGSEDGIEELTVPRLVACGADLSKIVEIQGVSQGGQRASFSMQDDLAAVRNMLDTANKFEAPFALLVVDPITSYLTGQRLRKVDLNDAGQLRSVLEPWLVVAQEYNLAIVCVTHFMKDTTRAMLHRVLGSAAFTQTCRSLCAVVARPEAGMYAKTLLQVKVNLPDHPGGAWLFSTEKVLVATDHLVSKPIHATRPNWERLDESVTPESIAGTTTRAHANESTGVFGFWVKSHFMNIPIEQGLRVADVKAAAIASKVASSRWWDDHSGMYLEKVNHRGVWLCRPNLIRKICVVVQLCVVGGATTTTQHNLVNNYFVGTICRYVNQTIY